MAVSSVYSNFEKYVEFIKKNPLLVNELEVGLRWLSYFAAGRFSQSVILSELVHSGSNLLTLLNDTILRKAANVPVHTDIVVERLKTSLSIIEYVEVFAEVTARGIGGNKVCWLVIVVIQIVKCVIRLILVLQYKQGMQPSPSITPLNRRRDVPKHFNPNNGGGSSCDDDDEIAPGLGVTFTLKRSGRVIRTLESAPPLSGRTWRLPVLPENAQTGKLANMLPIPLSKEETVAEILHITRPLVHLAAVAKFGNHSWTSFLTALFMDISSLRMLKCRNGLQHPERIEWSRRAVVLLVYLLRSPFYDHFSKVRILAFLWGLCNNVPGAGIIIRPFIEYIPEWQKTYFYIWSL